MPRTAAASLARFLRSSTSAGAGGLSGFRHALERLQHRLQEAARPSRLMPVEDLSLARILFNAPTAAAASPASAVAAGPVVGEILDISHDGMKIALAVSQPVEVDENCHLLVGPPEGECFELSGTVRWVDRNPYITVFGLHLRDATLHNPAAD